MKHYTKIWQPHEVTDAESFANYAQQQLGIPYPTIKMMGKLKKDLKAVLEANPGMTYASLPRIVEWARAKKKRYADPVRLLACYRFAFQDGYLPELSDRYEERINVDEIVDAALRIETDPEWRRALMLSDSLQEKIDTYNKWVEVRSSVLASTPI